MMVITSRIIIVAKHKDPFHILSIPFHYDIFIGYTYYEVER